jgi:hypothetical protein
MSVQLEVKGLDKLIKMAEKYPAVAERRIGDAIQSSFQLIAGVVNSKAPRGVTGDLRQAWKKEYRRFYGKFSSGVSYAAAVEYGTAPHYVSPRVLAPWAEKKGLNPFAVSKSIQKKGTKANPFFADTVEYSEKGIDRIFKDALTKITKEIV